MASLHELFQWGIENQSASNTSSSLNEPKKQLSAFDRNFLNAAMRSDASKMKGLLDIYQSKDSSLEEKEIALEDLEFFVQTIDNACDLSHSTVNGLITLLNAIKYQRKEGDFFRSSQVRMRAAWVLATALQNNPKLQSEAQKNNALHILTETLNDEISFLSSFISNQSEQSPLNQEDILDYVDRGDLSLISKLVFAISALIETKPAIKQFREENGFHSLNNLLSMRMDDLTRVSETRENLRIQRERQLFTQQGDENLIERIDKEIAEEDQKEASDIIEIEDDVKSRARLLQKERALIRMGRDTKAQKSEDDFSLWLRCARRTVFIYKKLMDNHEEIKYAFIKDHNGETLQTISKLLCDHNQDLDLREKTILALSSLLLGENALQKHALKDLKLNQTTLVQELLQNVVQTKNLEDEQSSLMQPINQIIKSLQT